MFSILLFFVFEFFFTYKNKIAVLLVFSLAALSLLKFDLIGINLLALLIFTFVIYFYFDGSYYKYVDFLQIAFYATFIGIVINYSLLILGVSSNRVFHVYTSDTVKNSLGFHNPNALGLYAFSLFVLFFFIDKDRVNYLIFVFSIYIMYLAAARTTVYGACIFFAFYILDILLKNKNLKSLIIVFYYLLFFLLSLLISFVWLLDSEKLLLGNDFHMVDYYTSFRLSLLKVNIEGWNIINFLVGGYGAVPIEMGWYHIFNAFGSFVVVVFLGYVFFLSRNFSADFFLYHSLVFVMIFLNLFENFFVTYNIISHLMCYFFITTFLYLMNNKAYRKSSAFLK